MEKVKIEVKINIPEGYEVVGKDKAHFGDLILNGKGQAEIWFGPESEREYYILRRLPKKQSSNQLSGQSTGKRMAGRHKHADEIHAWAEGAIIQFKIDPIDRLWLDCPGNNPAWSLYKSYRVKPAKKVIKFRNWLMKSGDIVTHQEGRTPDPTQCKNFVGWVGDWQQIEIEEQ